MNLIDVTFEVARSARWKELVLLYGQRVMEANPWSCPTGQKDVAELLAWSRRQTDTVPACLAYYLDTLKRCCPVCHRPSTEETTIGYIAALVPAPHDHNPNRFLCEKGHRWGRVCPVAESEWRSKWAEPGSGA